MKKLISVCILFITYTVSSQNEKVEWMSFADLEIALTKTPKKVLINFYADWCVYCKKMENVVYTKPDIIKELQSKYYSVAFNVESQDSIRFGGKTFINRNLEKKRFAYHEIAELLARQKNKSLVLPAIVILDENFKIEKRFFRYISPKEMLSILKK